MVAKRNARYLGQLIAAGAVMFIPPTSDLDLERLTRGSRANADSPVNAPAPLEVRAAGANDDWWQAVTAELSRAEYAASVTSTGLEAPNRAHDMRTTFDARGIAVGPRTETDTAPPWHFAWQTTGFGRPGEIEEVSPSSPSAAGARVVYEHDGWSEWYENSAKGLEQGFTIVRRPTGEGSLHIIGGFPATLRAEVRADGAIDFMDRHGASVLRYGELHAWDARGVSLASELVAADAEVTIVVEDRGAEYPLTIDPLMTTPAWTAEGDRADALFGTSVATAGDVNGDGFSDVIVGALFYDHGEPFEGRAFVYMGSAAGLATSAAWTAESNQPNAFFGRSVATAGDVNGDGFSDVIIGAVGYDSPEANEGRVFVYHGSAAGLASTAAWTAESQQIEANFGCSVGTAGDVNGDGFSDVIIGADAFDNPENGEGRAYTYYGSAAGLATTPAWVVESNQPNAHLGVSVGTAGDVNGDGFSDVIVGAYLYDNGPNDEGRAYAYHGSAAGLATTPAWIVESNQASSRFGVSVATAGDVNGDGFADVIVGAELYDNTQTNQGRAFAYHGSAGGLLTTPAWTAESIQAGASFGHSVGTAGDVNGDGFSDALVAAHNASNGQPGEGVVFAYLGSAAGLATSAAWFAQGNQASANFGNSVATAGDVNGDGFSDVIVGAPQYDNGEPQEGRAFVYLGMAIGLAAEAGWTAEGDQADAQFGTAVATAGDVNGDGFSDVIVGAETGAFVYHGSAAGPSTTPAWTDGRSVEDQLSVATAGDVNGDGYSDVIVGDPLLTNPEGIEGGAFVYHGSASGLSTTPAWTAEGNQVSASFGLSVGTAGDVNGDGFSDIIVGAWHYENGQNSEGRAYVYHGSASGLSTTPAWIAESDLQSAYFGVSVGTAGDVNGDGFSDAIVGASGFTSGHIGEGRAFVYHGSATGLGITPAWITESNQAEAKFGSSVGTAGDVNGDGFSDVIVGAIQYDNGQDAEGRAFLYQGSSAGLATSPAWTAESDALGALFGSVVGSAGDVNHDGYSDVIVGAGRWASDVGRVYVYHGGAAGLSTIQAWTAVGEQTFSGVGWALGMAGDVNADGHSDVIVGAYGHDNDQFDEGRAYVYYGNGGDGIDRNARQLRMNDATPISFLGRSDSQSAFRLRVVGRTAVGRGKVRLEFEVKPLGVPFDGTGLVSGAAFDTGVPVPGIGSAVPLAGLADGLTPDTLYRWRLRVLSNSPLFPSTPWFALPFNNRTETDLRTARPSSGVASGEAPAAQLPMLEPMRPNPLRTQGEIAYTLPAAGKVRLTVVDVAGRVRAVLADAQETAGRHTARWDARDRRGAELASGVYFLRLESANGIQVQRVVITR